MTMHDLAARLDALESENQLLHARVAELEATVARDLGSRRRFARVGGAPPTVDLRSEPTTVRSLVTTR